ncbi:MAG: sigma-54-dependent Fis family transcriptional regulator [Acidobacteria bacterium]|nr:sigma-54-dependent Fis family transcriptional regulator [Acidobacteriota bacterium]
MMERAVGLAERVARSDASALIVGESGTGKGLLAELIHRRGTRRERPFVTVSCANIPADLFESELFGHERGSHTDATTRKPGRLEAADGGTVFLDGVESLAPPHQAKLLRVLQERSFERLGGLETVRVDIRILSSSREDLTALVATGAFREDLYYRLNVVTIAVPPLRERPEDVFPLARHFLKRLRARDRRGPRRFGADARRAMRAYHWPGNVREVMNAVEAAMIVAEGDVVGAEALPIRHGTPMARMVAAASDEGLTLAALEERYIREVLRLTRGNKTRAAAILGISRKTLIAKTQRYEGGGEPD